MSEGESDPGEPGVAYHGTPVRDAVLASGLRPDSWLALDPLVAARYGDVVEVDLSQLDGTWPRSEDEVDGPVGSLCWQAHTGRDTVPVQLLKRVDACATFHPQEQGDDEGPDCLGPEGTCRESHVAPCPLAQEQCDD
jgi:hypothetical protein